MPYYSKPSGPYYINSTEGQGNVWEMSRAMTSRGYTLEAQCGVIGNCYGESGLNPWRWQNDQVSMYAGYGLFQFTPASGYIGPMSHVAGYGPNMSTAGVQGGLVTDGDAQMSCLLDDSLSKWVGYCWRDYWDPTQFPALFQRRTAILNTYGNGSYLSQAQFSTISSIEDAVLAFLACYEGPAYPDFATRVDFARTAYTILTGQEPPEPPPGPTPHSRLPLWIILKKSTERR